MVDTKFEYDSENDGNESDDDEKYGCMACKSSYLQCLNNIRCHVVFQCVFNFFEGFIVNGVINVVLVALEKRYSLASSKSGLIASSNDFGAIFSSVLIGYFGEHRHKPRILGTGIIIMVLGCFVFSLPHFIGGKYQYTVSSDSNGNNSENVCTLNNNRTDECQRSTLISLTESSSLYYALLMLGNVLLGIGASPMFTLGLSYIDENCKPKLTSFYISWTFCAAAVGVAIGYVVGGQTLNIFVDIDKVDRDSMHLTSMDPQWVGAWWIAPIFALIGLFVVAFPIYGYPRRLPNYREVQKIRISEAHGGGHAVIAQKGFGKSWRDFPKSLWLLITNPTFVFICCGAAVEAMIIGGTATFGAKLIQEMFNVDIAFAGTVMGIITIPGSGGGMLLGGYFVKKFNLKCRGILRMCAFLMLVGMCVGPFLLIHCKGNVIAGLDIAYINETSISGLVSKCNIDCGCTTRGFEPVCVNDVVYFSPCHAGCLSSESTDGVKVFTDCSCATNTTSSNQSVAVTSETCTGRCKWLYVFCTLFLIVMILTFATMSPGVTALIRCVPDKQRSFAIGINLLFVRLVGTMTGPVFLGAIIDSTCLLWQQSCSAEGSCWIYDKFTGGVRIMLWFMALKFCGFVLFLTASFVYKPPSYEHFIEIPVTDIAPASLPGRYDVNKKIYVED